jgi:hypothetical protein
MDGTVIVWFPETAVSITFFSSVTTLAVVDADEEPGESCVGSVITKVFPVFSKAIGGSVCLKTGSLDRLWSFAGCLSASVGIESAARLFALMSLFAVRFDKTLDFLPGADVGGSATTVAGASDGASVDCLRFDGDRDRVLSAPADGLPLAALPTVISRCRATDGSVALSTAGRFKIPGGAAVFSCRLDPSPGRTVVASVW